MTIHLLFDLISAAGALAVTVFVYHWRLKETAPLIERQGAGYAVALVLGAAIGGYGFGTLNLWLSGIPEIGRSILGALFGAIAAIELYKWRAGIHGSTGVVFVAGLATSILIGRWGCFLAGLADVTYGTPTNLPWGHDFGDGIQRHPVQLYESFSMGLFLVMSLWLLRHRSEFFLSNGFYLLVAWYAAQRFVWEFFKPYAPVLGPFNVFHLLCAGLLVYAAVMVARHKPRYDAIDQQARAPSP